MNWLQVTALVVSCFLTRQTPDSCLTQTTNSEQVAGKTVTTPAFTGEAIDVELTAQTALAWDVQTGHVLYSKQADARRPVASLSKLLSAVAIRRLMPLNQSLEIPPAVRAVQRYGADIRLPVGEHATVHDLLQAGLVASANDAMVTLAIGARHSEENFADYANTLARELGLVNTRVVNATGLSESNKTQYSTASDMRALLLMVYRDGVLASFMDDQTGHLRTAEGTVRQYKSTDKLLGSYLPVVIAKTGYTAEAGENLALITTGQGGQRIGAVILGSANRWHDMKVLVEWLERNYTW